LSAEHCRVAFAKRNHERQKNEAFKSFEDVREAGATSLNAAARNP
jgi:hypothetical protein